MWESIALKDLIPFVPFFQTLLWIILILVVIVLLRPEIAVLRKVLIKRLEEGSSFEIGFVKIGELREEIQSVRKGLDATNKKISLLFLTTMSSTMYVNLKKLASGFFGQYKMNNGLERELYHLRDIGYIEVQSIKKIPIDGQNLSDHIKVTSTGQQFVNLRESLVVA